MTSSTNSSRGDIVLVRFIFADEQGAKRRPVVVLSTDGYHRGRQEVIVAALTSNVERLLPGDRKIDQWREAGLPKASVVTGILRTIKSSMIDRRLGALTQADLRGYEVTLRHAIGL